MTTDNRAALVARIETLLEKATAGPWRVSMRGYSVKSNNDDMPIVVQNPWGTSMRERDIPRWLDNAELIAATPELLRDVLSLLTAEPERPTVADHYGHGWQAGVSSVSTCRQCGQFLNHGHACGVEPERPVKRKHYCGSVKNRTACGRQTNKLSRGSTAYEWAYVNCAECLKTRPGFAAEPERRAPEGR